MEEPTCLRKIMKIDYLNDEIENMQYDTIFAEFRTNNHDNINKEISCTLIHFTIHNGSQEFNYSPYGSDLRIISTLIHRILLIILIIIILWKTILIHQGQKAKEVQ
jgi:hypothetical protein